MEVTRMVEANQEARHPEEVAKLGSQEVKKIAVSYSFKASLEAP